MDYVTLQVGVPVEHQGIPIVSPASCIHLQAL